jgi:hypothetical protein
MDKWATKLVAEAIGIRTAPGRLAEGSGGARRFGPDAARSPAASSIHLIRILRQGSLDFPGELEDHPGTTVDRQWGLRENSLAPRRGRARYVRCAWPSPQGRGYGAVWSPPTYSTRSTCLRSAHVLQLASGRPWRRQAPVSPPCSTPWLSGERVARHGIDGIQHLPDVAHPQPRQPVNRRDEQRLDRLLLDDGVDASLQFAAGDGLPALLPGSEKS